MHYMCLDSFIAVPMPTLAEMCIKYICSISATMHAGALREYCSVTLGQAFQYIIKENESILIGYKIEMEFLMVKSTMHITLNSRGGTVA